VTLPIQLDLEGPAFDRTLEPRKRLPDGIVADGPDDSDWPADVFAHLPLFGYDFLMVDPPWHFSTHSMKGQDKGALRHYRTWTLRKIKALPVGQLASRNCTLMLWGTSPLLLDAEQPSRSPMGEVLEAWGFRYGAFGGWAKRTRNKKLRYGPGYVLRSVMEPFLIAATGSPQHDLGTPNLIEGLARRHSEKPDAAYRWAEKYMPNARRIEICSRTNRPGWDVWGDQTGMFND
jgi:N6-adenosine-specific RNA methylase IME4